MKVSIIILTWNEKKFTLECLKSVIKQKFNGFEIIVVDNGSTDDTVMSIRKRFPRIKIIENKKNYGFAEGNNIGVRTAKGEYIVILNNDTIVDKNWLQELYNFMTKEKNTGIIMSKVYDKYGKNKFSFFYETINPLGYPIKYKFNRKKQNWPFFAKGCSLMYKKDLVKDPFDKDYFIYAEDTWLSWKLRLKGYEVKLASKSVLKHYGEVTTKKFKSKKNYLMEKNRLLNFLTFYNIKNLILLSPWMLFSMIFHNLYDLSNAGYRFKGYWWNIRNIRLVLKKRRDMQRLRKIKDSKFTKYMVNKFFDETSIDGKVAKGIIIIINFIFKIYARIILL